MLKDFWNRVKEKIFGCDFDLQIRVIGEELRLIDMNTGIYFTVTGENELMGFLKNKYKEE